MSGRERDTTISYSEKRDATQYEYVIVGSGGPLAARLAMAGHSVLLIEAGDDRGANIDEQVPVFHGKSTEDEAMRWDYWFQHDSDTARAEKDSKFVYTTPSRQEYYGTSPPSGSTPKGILYPRAGTLGGCVDHNALITIHPIASDWDYIHGITGDSSGLLTA
jgi:choline dehydrogenase